MVRLCNACAQLLTAVCRLIRTIAAVIHCVTLPPEWYTLICATAKLQDKAEHMQTKQVDYE